MMTTAKRRKLLNEYRNRLSWAKRDCEDRLADFRAAMTALRAARLAGNVGDERGVALDACRDLLLARKAHRRAASYLASLEAARL
jgi:hypothetical protein